MSILATLNNDTPASILSITTPQLLLNTAGNSTDSGEAFSYSRGPYTAGSLAVGFNTIDHIMPGLFDSTFGATFFYGMHEYSGEPELAFYYSFLGNSSTFPFSNFFPFGIDSAYTAPVAFPLLESTYYQINGTFVQPITSSDSEERLKGTANADYIVGGTNDTLLGGKGDDYLYDYDVSNTDASAGEAFSSIVMRGGKGNDAFFIYNSNESHVIGGAGNDSIRVEYGTGHTINGGADDDIITNFSNIEAAYMLGGSGNDSLIGGSGDDTQYGGSGDDTIAGEQGNDLIKGNKGDDQLRGGDGMDTILGGNGADVIWGNAGGDILRGGNDDDYLYGEEGNDLAIGGKGNDYILDTSGADTLRGSAGNDTVASYHSRNGDAEQNQDAASVLYGGAGNDVLRGSANDSLYGGRDNDGLFAQGENSFLYGGSGNDWLGDSTNTETAINNTHFFGGRGDDTIVSYGNNFEARGGVGDDTFVFGAFVIDNIFVDRTIIGGSEGNIYGGEGNDIFHFNTANLSETSTYVDVTIHDFTLGDDSIMLAGHAMDAFTIENNAQGDAVLSLYDNQYLTLSNIDAAQLSENDFL